jgi:hypothetical protein
MYSSPAALHSGSLDVPGAGLLDRINGRNHELALRAFMVVVLAHWGEHLLQALQIYVLGWPVPEARGALGYFYPWLVKSEVLHYSYAVVMLVGLWLLRRGFTGTLDRRWWMIAFGIQFWHHIEHLLLIGQYMTGHNLFGRPVPTSILQLWLPRVELHLFYNTIVFIPMVIAMYHHMFPPPADATRQTCSCAWHKRTVAAAA